MKEHDDSRNTMGKTERDTGNATGLEVSPGAVSARDGETDSSPSVPRTTVAVWLLLAVHALLLCTQAWRSTPTYDEVAHLPSGLSHWHFGDFEMYCVNPPLMRMLAALPLLVDPPETNWDKGGEGIFSRPEFPVGTAFLKANGRQSFWYFAIARISVIPVILLGAWVAYCWATELYGRASGYVALMLWCFCPNLLAWGAQITPDAPAASFGLLAAWLFWRWLRCPTMQSAAMAGLGLGLAELTKSSWIILFALWPILWMLWRISIRRTELKKPSISGLTAILLGTVYLLNLGYGFEGTCSRLDSFTFISKSLGGDAAHKEGGNRFKQTVLGWIPVPLPANYVRGIDVQKHDFEEGKWSYLCGEQKKGGWWYYYLYGLLIKTPLGFLGLFALAAVLGVCREEYRSHWRDEAVLLLPALMLLALVSSQTGFNRYIRYVVPALPFLYIATARIARAFDLGHRWIRWTCVFGLVAGIAGSITVFPYSMSYFNCAVGGPIGGKSHLLDANIDWGQDLLELKEWLEENPQANPVKLKYFGFVRPETAEIEFEPVPPAPGYAKADRQSAPVPGWYAISVNHLMGYHHFAHDRPGFVYFQQLKPVARIGYSIYIYHVGEAEVAVLTKHFREHCPRDSEQILANSPR
jgi:4-amino-4-deoxy-L-arabinose transferase-like glycosyltransferase